MVTVDDPEHARFAELNALAGVLPCHRRDELSALLSDADVGPWFRALQFSLCCGLRLGAAGRAASQRLPCAARATRHRRRARRFWHHPQYACRRAPFRFSHRGGPARLPLPEAMAQSQHTSVQQAARYDNDAERRMGRAARLLG
jgi:hypothetical protein